MNGPLIGASGGEAIVQQCGDIADAHAGVTDQQNRVTAEIIPAKELLVEELILLSGEGAWQSFWEPRNVLSADQMGEFRKRLGPSQLLEDGSQMNEQVDAGCGGQRRRLRAQARHPAEDVWIATQLIERAYLGMSGAEVSQELANSPAVVTSRLWVHRGSEGVDVADEQRGGGGTGPIQPQAHAELGFGKQYVLRIQSQHFGRPQALQ